MSSSGNILLFVNDAQPRSRWHGFKPDAATNETTDTNFFEEHQKGPCDARARGPRPSFAIVGVWQTIKDRPSFDVLVGVRAWNLRGLVFRKLDAQRITLLHRHLVVGLPKLATGMLSRGETVLAGTGPNDDRIRIVASWNHLSRLHHACGSDGRIGKPISQETRLDDANVVEAVLYGGRWQLVVT